MYTLILNKKRFFNNYLEQIPCMIMMMFTCLEERILKRKCYISRNNVIPTASENWTLYHASPLYLQPPMHSNPFQI